MLESEVYRLKAENIGLHQIIDKMQEKSLFDTYLEKTMSILVRELKEGGYISENIIFLTREEQKEKLEKAIEAFVKEIEDAWKK